MKLQIGHFYHNINTSALNLRLKSYYRSSSLTQLTLCSAFGKFPQQLGDSSAAKLGPLGG